MDSGSISGRATGQKVNDAWFVVDSNGTDTGRNGAGR